MRFSLLTMTILMTLILLGGMLSWRILDPSRSAEGQDVLIVMIDGSGVPGLDEELWAEGERALKPYVSAGMACRGCRAPSPWYPAAAATLLTGLYPTEHGLTEAHATLSLRAATLFEECLDAGYKTCAFIERGSLLACTGVLQGAQRVIEGEGTELTEHGLAYFLRHCRAAPCFGLIEIDAHRFGGASGVAALLAEMLAVLRREGFLDEGMLVVCAPGCEGWLEDAQEMRSAPLRDFLFLAGDLTVPAPAGSVDDLASLADLARLLASAALGPGQPGGVAPPDRGVVLAEAALPLDAPAAGRGASPPPRTCRVAWFHGLGFRAFIGPDGAWEFQDKAFGPVAPDPREEALARKEVETYLAGRVMIDDLNIQRMAGPFLDEELAARLGRVWLRPSFLGRSLHAIDHFRLGEALVAAGFAALAVTEYRAALAIDPEFGDAAFALAAAYEHFGPEQALPYYRAFLERFSGHPGQESNVAAARAFTSAANTPR